MSSSGAHNLPSLRRSVRKTSESGSEKNSRSKRRRSSSSPEVVLRRRRVGENKEFVEQTASPSLRMQSADDDVHSEDVLTFAKFATYMDERVLGQIADVNKKLDKVNEQVDSNTHQIRLIKTELDKVKASGGPGPGPHNDVEWKRYEKSRRSIRIWPVRGTSETELWRNTGIFLHTTLSIPHDEMEEERISEIRRMRTGGTRIKDEALVVFIDAETRDFVTGFARNLANAVDTNGNPTAGLRMDIPIQLMSVFKLLETHGRKMRDRYGKEFKRHIRYDDSARSLYLNVKLPQEENWTRISPGFARSMAEEEESGREMRDRFGTSGTWRPMSSLGGPSPGRGSSGPCPPGPSGYRKPRYNKPSPESMMP